MADYNVNEIEKKWQQYWEENNSYKAEVDTSKPKFYALDMFPYPSGAGLHVGHPLGYIASDIVSRYKRLQGYNVLHPMGFDAFGLPAEQYAIQTGQHPAITTEENIKHYKEQLKNIGFSFDWDKEVRTSDPKFYKWTQWIFMQLFDSWYNKSTDKAEPVSELIAIFEKEGNSHVNAECDEETSTFTAEDWKSFSEKEQQEILLKYRLAYLANTTVNWCPALGTVLSNDEVKDGFSERGGHPVERKNMMQWMMRITAYSERLLRGLDKIDWPEPLKEMQRNWIGKSVGAEVDFKIAPPPSPFSNGEGEQKGVRPDEAYKTSNPNRWKVLKEFGRDNRKNPTEEEDAMWQALRNKKTGYKIRRQHAIGDFIADFVCIPEKLVIEIDGDSHLEEREYDQMRTEYLNEFGFRVVRFTNKEVNEDIDKVVEKVKRELASPPSPLSNGEGEQKGVRPSIRIFTTRLDTIFGATFLVLAPESELVEQLTTPDQKEAVKQYVEVAKNRSERERMMDVKHVTGVFTGAYVEHPFSGEKLPIWVADYVLAGYGTGAVMAVPAGDQRDYDFAKHFELPIVKINDAMKIEEEADPTRAGKIINSDFLNGLSPEEAMKKGVEELERRDIGHAKINYRMRDAIFTRQRYWGEPLPVYFKEGMPYLMEEKELPLVLPEVDKYLPTEDGAPPLGRAKDWTTEQGHAIELSTMPGWAGSSWYFFRYMDAHNEDEFVSKKAQEYWENVDLYIGGSEHATGHLLYSRFWVKFLFDMGFVTVDEPFKKLINQGMIQGRSNFVYRVKNTNKYVSYNLRKDYETTPLHVDVNIVYNDELNLEKFKAWRAENEDAEFILEDSKYICGHEVEKMSKSKYNVVNPDDIIERYGADTLRLYEMFLGPLEQFKPWNTNGIDGVFKFLRKLWNLFHDDAGNFYVSKDEPTKAEFKALHKTIKKATEDIERYSFNTSVSEFMICVNELTALKCNKAQILTDLIITVSPYAPHIAEELWHKLGNVTSITQAEFPKFNESYLVENEHEYPVSVNGKMRAKMNFPMDMPKEDIEKQVLASEVIQKWTEGKTPKKVIIVPKKIVNIVI